MADNTHQSLQEAQLSPRDRAMRRVSWNLPIATQQHRNYLYDKSWTKYQLSLIDPCDKIVLWTELDDLCDKL